MHVPLESHKEKQVLTTSQTWGEIWISKFMKLMGDPKVSIQNIHLQDTIIKVSENKDKKRILQAARKKYFSHKSINF